MTHITYNTCDRCGAKDDSALRIWHHSVHDVTGQIVAHLCDTCLMEVAPRSEELQRRAELVK